MDVPPSFTIVVKYQLKEYLEVVRNHAQSLRTKAGKDSFFRNLVDEAIFATFGTAMFFFKSWRVGECAFTLSSEGVTRNSRDGVVTIPWSCVQALRKYDSSYLVDMGDGAMPIPFRVLSVEQQRAIESWAGASLDGRAA